MVSACCTQPVASIPDNPGMPDATAVSERVTQVAQGLSQKDYDDADSIAQVTMFEIALHSRDLPTAAAIARDMAQSKRDLEMAKRAWVLYTLLHDRDQALQAAITWRDIDPGNKQAQIQYLFAQASLGHYDPLIRELRSQLENRVPSFEARLEMVAGLVQKIGDQAVALTVFEQITHDIANLSPEEQSVLDFYHAVFASEAGDFDKALDLAQKAARDPEREPGAIILMLHIADGPQRMSILSQASRYLAEHPDNEAVRTAYVDALGVGGLWDTALEEIDKLIKAFPQKSQYAYQKAYILYKAERYPQALTAVKDFERAARKGLEALGRQAQKDPSVVEEQLKMLQASPMVPPDHAGNEDEDPAQANLTKRESVQAGLKRLRTLNEESAALLRGSILSAQGHPQQAVAQFNLIQSPASRPAVLLDIADVYASQHKFDEALRAVEQVPEESSAYVPAQRLRAMVYHQQGKNEKAVQLLGELRQHGVKDPDVMLFHAEALGYLGRWDEVESEYRSALELHPNNAEIYNSYGFTLADRDTRLDSAELLLERALTMEPDSPYIWDSYGWLQFRQGHLNLARTYLEMAWSSDPNIAEIAAHLAELYHALEDNTKAREYLKKAQAIDPEDRAVKNATEALQSTS